ncbi:hypothetical protein FJV46_02220 [Arthrobacter agilis]|uniref:DUF6286 domain-containing protein n=1 Tax=Arthrobacter agilis TaxID=37921 RepID=UPI000B3571F8|nr:DUF6286 domain-containing protein [Arthrobacter agilis]OUM40683.1 hypothetical protein B8W74_14455 [Arthrobacter agilis]PPB45293.1 hypothetical protein CI784_14485 [Arthrobacter agilis]TPV28001.1 hypothetical protein FJV46_02220 [Arthrobacter agilis]VDR31307.1 Uncharacterised protein [Arthrobacter agilis]
MSSTPKQDLRRRPSRTVPATLTSLVLVLVGAALAWTGIAGLGGDTSPAEGSLAAASGLTWGSTAVSVIVGALLLAGLVLLLAALLPGRRTLLTAGTTWDGTEGTTTVISRSAVERLAAARACGIDGVSSAGSRLRGSRLRVSITTHLRSTADLQDAVGRAVQSSVDDLGLMPAPRVGTHARTEHDD